MMNKKVICKKTGAGKFYIVGLKNHEFKKISGARDFWYNYLGGKYGNQFIYEE